MRQCRHRLLLVVAALALGIAHGFVGSSIFSGSYVRAPTNRRSEVSRRGYTPASPTEGERQSEYDAIWKFEMTCNPSWETRYISSHRPYVSPVVKNLAKSDPQELLRVLETMKIPSKCPLWTQIMYEASHALRLEPQAGQALYTGLLSQPDLITAVVEHVANIMRPPSSANLSSLFPPTLLRNMFLQELTSCDRTDIKRDLLVCAIRSLGGSTSSMAPPPPPHSPSASCSDGSLLSPLLFNSGLHALLCHRVGHRLWRKGRTGLAKFLQSVVSTKFSCDLHPAAAFESGIYMPCSVGVVVGETAKIGAFTSIFQGVTLGGTGKDKGDRHPKLGRGVTVMNGATVLGNIKVGKGAVVLGKSIVLKEVVDGGVVSGIPAKFKKLRDDWKDDIDDSCCGDDLLWWGGHWMTEAGICTKEEEETHMREVKKAFEPLLTNDGMGTDVCG